MRNALAAAVVALTIFAGVQSSPATAQTPSFSGDAPPAGSIGLLVTSGPASASTLVSDLGAGGCSVAVIAVLRDAVWSIYIVGAPAAVNAQFPPELEDITPFFVRCAGAGTPPPSSSGPNPGGNWPDGPPGPAGNR